MYNGKLYKCTTATTGGTWVSSSWTEAVLSNDVTDLKNALSDVKNKNVGLTIGRYLTDGVTPKANDYAYVRNMEPIKIDGIDHIVLPSGYNATVYLLNASKEKISHYAAHDGFVNFNFVTSATKYINFQIKSKDAQVTDLRSLVDQINKGTAIVSTYEKNTAINNDIVSNNLFPGFSSKGHIDSTGTFVSDDYYVSTDYVPYIGGSITLTDLYNNASNYRTVAFYSGKSASNYIDGVDVVTSDTTIAEADIPDGTKYVRFCTNLTESVNPQIEINGNVFDAINKLSVDIAENSSDIARLESEQHNDIYNTVSKVYGVEFDHDGTSLDTSACTRIGDAYGLQTNYIIGTTMANTGDNDFDYVYPWGAIRRCNIVSGDIVYEGETGFAVDGTNGDVFVEIPKFYSFREVANGKERICISGTKHGGFQIEPVFIDANGNELDYVYVGAYETSDNDKSISGLFPTVDRLMSIFVSDANSKGFGTYDYAMFIALQKLVLVEYADKDMSQFFNGIGELPYFNHIVATENESNSNTIHVRNNMSQNLRVGQWVSVSDNNQSGQPADRQVTDITVLGPTTSIVTFSGEPVNVTKDVTTIYATAQPTGSTDILTYHTGRFADNNISAFRYRWIENLWGNTWTQCIGAIIKNLEYYVTTDPDEYDGQISAWEKLPYDAPLQADLPSYNNGFILTEGYDRANRLFALPLSVGTNDDPYGDQFYSKSETNTEWILVTGGGWDHSTRNGNFTSRFWYRRSGNGSGDGGNSWLVGSRLVARYEV